MKIARKAAMQMHATLTMSSTTMGVSCKRMIRIVMEEIRTEMQILEMTRIRPPTPPRGRGRRSEVVGLSNNCDSHGVNDMKRKLVAQISKLL